MNGFGFLFASLTLAALGIGLYLLGPALDRWEARLSEALAALRARQDHQR
jgi:hypothetical protein